MDVSRSTVQLSWEPPEDDGGSPVIDYIIEKREVSRKTWIKVCSFFIIPFVFAILFPHAAELSHNFVITLWKYILEAQWILPSL